jgi:hypothetical protein
MIEISYRNFDARGLSFFSDGIGGVFPEAEEILIGAGLWFVALQDIGAGADPLN